MTELEYDKTKAIEVFRNSWADASRDKVASELMTALKPKIEDAILEYHNKKIYDLEEFIGDYEKESSHRYPEPFPMKSNHKITNVDLNFWRDLSFLINRYSEGYNFSYYLKSMNDRILRQMHKVRKYQVWQSYKETGITIEHKKLLARMVFEGDLHRGDWISIFAEGKRPFGNSSIECDMLEILGWYDPEETNKVEFYEKLWELFDQLPFALNDLIQQATLQIR